MKPLRVFTAFSGYDSQCLALDRLKRYYREFDYTLVGWSEIDKSAIIAHNALYPEASELNYGDICQIDWQSVPDFDLFTYSFPCGLAGTLVKTYGGYRKIEDIQEGELVLTHNNRFRHVTKVMSRNAPHYYRVKAQGCLLRLTGEHPLYVLRDGKQQWVRVCDLEKDDMLSYNIPDVNIKSELDDNILWLLGRYVADGWINQLLYKSVEFAIAFEKEDEFVKHIPADMPCKKNKKTCWEYRIADESFQSLCYTFGCGSKNKHIPRWVTELPVEQIKVFLDGYFSGDGHVRYRSGTKVQMFSTVSKELFCGVQQLLIKVYEKVCSLSIRHDGRKETFNDTYNGQIAFSEKTQQVVVDGKIYVPIRNIEKVMVPVRVFNISVADDESYTCDNVISHNCTDISAAGQQRGLDKDSGTRSSLLWECEKAIKIKRPKYLLMENVKALVQKKFIKDYHAWVSLLDSYGYVSWGKVLNAKDYGIPQNRERVFLISIHMDGLEGLAGNVQYHFPKPFPLELRLKDVLEEHVDEKYYLSDKMLEYFNRVNDDKSHGHDFKPTDGGGTAFAIRTAPGQRVDDTFLKEDEQ